MSFSEFMNGVFGADWLGNVIQILSSIALIWITKIYSNIKIKLLNSDNKYAKDIGNLLDNNIQINTELLNVKAENAELKEEVKTTSDSVCKLINIVSLAFLDSKGVSSETKLAISKVIGEIEATGVDLNKINKTVESATKVAETTVEAVNKIHDQVEEHIEDSIEVAEGIKETSLDIYNTILDNANEQQA